VDISASANSIVAEEVPSKDLNPQSLETSPTVAPEDQVISIPVGDAINMEAEAQSAEVAEGTSQAEDIVTLDRQVCAEALAAALASEALADEVAAVEAQIAAAQAAQAAAAAAAAAAAEPIVPEAAASTEATDTGNVDSTPRMETNTENPEVSKTGTTEAPGILNVRDEDGALAAAMAYAAGYEGVDLFKDVQIGDSVVDLCALRLAVPVVLPACPFRLFWR